MFSRYLKKMKGMQDNQAHAALSGDRTRDVIWSWVGSLVGILVLSVMDSCLCEGTDRILIIASFGASAVMVFGAVESQFAQPRNLVGGHLISAFIGVSAYQLFGSHPWLAAAVAVATSTALMQLTATLHPPGGGTALIAVIGDEKIHALGFYYLLAPVAAGVGILLITALLVNNLSGKRRYPDFWR